LQQQDVDFEWIIIDDGSTDNTKEVVSSFEKSFSIKYHKQQNKGKPSAINTGVDLAKSHITVILDDKNILCPNVLKDVWNYHEKESGKFTNNCACIAGLIKYDNGAIIGKKFPDELLVSDHIACIHNKEITGSKCFFYISDILKKYPYPIIENEKFITSDIINSRIALMHKTMHTNQVFMEKELSTEKMPRDSYFKDNPLGSELYFNEISVHPFKHELQIKHSAEYIFYAKMNKRKNIYANAKNKKIFPLGLSYYHLSKIKFGTRTAKSK